MRRFSGLITAAATLGLAALACAQTSPIAGQPDSNAQPPDVSQPSGATQRSRFAELVPSDMSATEACSGFKSMIECAAALHADQNR